MNWLFLALLSQITYTINIFFDKYVVEERLPNYRSLPVFTSILTFFVGGMIWILNGFDQVSFNNFFFIVLSGIFTLWGFRFYIEALMKEETSIVIILIQLVPVIVLILSYLLLGETINAKQMAGFILLLSASILASLQRGNQKFQFSKALLYIIIADIMWASAYIAIKFASHSIDFTDLIIYESLGITIGGLSLYLFIKKTRLAFIESFKKINKTTVGVIFLNEGIFLFAKLLAYLAITSGPVTLVSVISSTQIFFGILFGVILTIILPKVFHEDLSKKSLGKKVGLSVLAFIGIYLIS